jgi:hypothetical protein
VPDGPSRRAVLVASAAALPLAVAGCRGTMALGTPPRPSAAVTRLRDQIAAEQLWVARSGAVGAGPARDPGLRPVLSALLAEHEQHLRLLRSRLVPGSPRAAGAGPGPGVPARPVPAADLASAHRAVAYLAAAEQAASDRLLAQVGLVPPALAQILASIAASEATHGPALRAAGAG